MKRILSFKKWLEAGGDSFPEPMLQNPVGAQLSGFADQGCDGAGGFPCIDKESLPPTPKMKKKMKKK